MGGGRLIVHGSFCETPAATARQAMISRSRPIPVGSVGPVGLRLNSLSNLTWGYRVGFWRAMVGVLMLFMAYEFLRHSA